MIISAKRIMKPIILPLDELLGFSCSASLHVPPKQHIPPDARYDLSPPSQYSLAWQIVSPSSLHSAAGISSGIDEKSSVMFT